MADTEGRVPENSLALSQFVRRSQRTARFCSEGPWAAPLEDEGGVSPAPVASVAS